MRNRLTQLFLSQVCPTCRGWCSRIPLRGPALLRGVPGDQRFSSSPPSLWEMNIDIECQALAAGHLRLVPSTASRPLVVQPTGTVWHCKQSPWEPRSRPCQIRDPRICCQHFPIAWFPTAYECPKTRLSGCRGLSFKSGTRPLPYQHHKASHGATRKLSRG